jgi:hypothetical protein
MPKQHMWVELKYTPIQVTEVDGGLLVLHTDELSEETANEEALNGCWFCFTPLNSDTFHTECEYDADEPDPIL